MRTIGTKIRATTSIIFRVKGLEDALCVVDCGTAVYQDVIRAQAEAGVVMGLSTAFYEKARFSGDRVKTANSDDYPVLPCLMSPK